MSYLCNTVLEFLDSVTRQKKRHKGHWYCQGRIKYAYLLKACFYVEIYPYNNKTVTAIELRKIKDLYVIIKIKIVAMYGGSCLLLAEGWQVQV